MMRRFKIIIIAVLMMFLQQFQAVSQATEAQNNQTAKYYSKLITKEDLIEHLSILASDALEGRETGKRGQKMAAAYIQANFESFGLAPIVENNGIKSFQMKVPLKEISGMDAMLKIGKLELKQFEGIVYYGEKDSFGTQKVPFVFCGSGDKAQLNLVNLKDKAAVVYNNEGFNKYQEIAKMVKEKGAKLLIIVQSDTDVKYKAVENQFKNYLSGSQMRLKKPDEKADKALGIMFISPTNAAKIFNSSDAKMRTHIKKISEGNLTQLKKVKSREHSFRIDIDEKDIFSENVLGFLEGSDLKDEVVVITAHYDHIGKLADTGDENADLINNGADDDGSGTTAVLEIAKAFSKAKKEGKGPRRSILFMTVCGEEKGLLGSEWYTDHPIIPLNKTVVDLNIDMIGRVDPEHEANANYVYLVGSNRLSSELHELSENVNAKTLKLKLDYTYNDENHPDRIYYRSDHWNFAKNNIPVIFYFNGVHEDYHKPSDEIEKINFNIFQKRTKLVFFTAWEIANRDKRLIVDKK